MIELQMVKRMVLRGLILTPILVLTLWLWDGSDYALSGAAGMAMTLVNLFVAGRIIGGVAETNPKLLLPAAMVAFTLGLAILTAVAFVLKTNDLVNFPVTGITLVVAHLVLVLWEAAGAYKIKPAVQARET